MTDFPVQLVVPVGAVLAAAITAIASFVSLVVAKEQKISEFRQTWIDALRREISEFASNARRVSAEERPVDLSALAGSIAASIKTKNEDVLRSDPFHDNRLQLAQAYFAIRLRLNPDEPDHTTILQGMEEVYGVLGSHTGDARFDKTVKALDNLSAHAQSVLKREWVRVKDGEPRYMRVAMAAKFVGIVLAIILIALVGYGVVIAI